MLERVVHRRRLRQAGEERRLRQAQPVRAGREERLRARLRPVGMLAVEHLVQVCGKDLLPGPALGELHRQASLFHLARQRPLRAADVQVANQLLGDRGAALDDPARAHVVVEGARDRLIVERTVLPEATVLDRNRGFRQPGRDRAQLQRLPVPRRRNNTKQRAVVRKQDRVLTERDRMQRVQAARAEHDRAAREPDRRNGDHQRAYADNQHRQHSPTVTVPVADANATGAQRSVRRTRHRRRRRPRRNRPLRRCAAIRRCRTAGLQSQCVETTCVDAIAGLGRGTAQTDQRYPGGAGQSTKAGTQPRSGGTDPNA